MTKDVRQLVRRLRELGVPVEQRRRGHLVAHTKGGPVFMALTPSCPRAVKNTISELRRRGVPV